MHYKIVNTLKAFLPFLFDKLDALCPAVDELMKLTTAPPGGHMAILQAAVQVL